jgi:hypothetical protein
VRLPPKAAAVAGTVRAMIAGGTLQPGDLAPSAPALQQATGTAYAYCLLAVRSLVDDGTLQPGKPPRGRPRVPRAPGEEPADGR